jgi:hypothetical protein
MKSRTVSALRTLGVAACSWFLSLSPSLAQENPPEAQQQGQPALGIIRLSFFELNVQTFLSSAEHPFYQMTKFNGFEGGAGSRNLTLDWDYEKFLTLGGDEDGHEEIEDDVQRILHALPPFYLEYIIPTNMFVAVSLMGGYTQTYLTDDEAGNPQKNSNTKVYPIIRLRSHYYMGGGNIYFTGMPEPGGTDIFFGVGAMVIQNTLRAGVRRTIFDTLPAEEVTELSASGGTAFFRRLGLALNGQSYGFTLDFLFVDDSQVVDNPFSKGVGGVTPTEFLDAYGNLGSALPGKVSLEGALMRASATYTFF